MQGVAELGERIEVIANNMQKYMSFRVGKQLVFIDSMQFMSSSLGDLVENLDNDRFKRMRCEWKGQELEMLLEKGVYPYEHMNCWEKFNEKSLPEKSAFYSSLYEEEVNDDDYLRACKVYEKFNCSNLGDYYDLYLKTDVLLLADVFEDFRRGVAELGERIEVIANNMQKYMSFRVSKQLVFIDSMQFMSSSLGDLVENLDNDRFKRMRCEWKGQELEMLLEKGVYPYEHMNCWEKFNEKSLPEKSAFYSSLYEEEVNDDDYLRACKVYEKFNCSNLGDYYDLYLKTDVLLLADVFEDFRRVCLGSYKLDPAHYIFAPGLSWDAMLKRTGIRSDLLSNVDMYQFIEKGMRGGVSYIGHRYAKANNKYMSDYDSSKPSS
ncbi:NYNRIN [Paramuricea clavata]|uniref:NYNRIN, partial n=1 Tax=Paramuricea clavata TaxID=317549 RepID=A0A6S7HNZ0_PARCT|nr:NYNRIN [Paramuricea clavata]